MSATGLKEKIQDYLELADDKVLEAIYTLLSTSVGEPIDLEAYNKDIDEALEDYKNDHTHSQEEMKKIAESWKKKDK